MLVLAGQIPSQAEATSYPLARANQALAELRRGAPAGGSAVVTLD